MELLRSLSFDGNIVQFYGACLQPESVMMVLEYMAVSHPHSYYMLSVQNICGIHAIRSDLHSHYMLSVQNTCHEE